MAGERAVFRILLTGGGTGGHIYPALALAEALRDLTDRLELLYVGTKDGLEADLVPKAGLPFITVRARGIISKKPLAALRGAFDLLLGYRASKNIVRRYRPHVAVGTGGYVTGPVLYAAFRYGVPVILHEQNAFPGVANRWLSRFAHTVAVHFEETRRYFPHARRVVTVGNPVRRDILSAQRGVAYKELGLCQGRPTVLIMSGSRGARTINEAAVEMLVSGTVPAQVILVTGKAYYDTTRNQLMASRQAVEDMKRGQIRVYPYLDRMDLALAAADLVVARAGATTIAELTARGVPSILVPSPNVTHDHQRHNAAILVNSGAALLLEEKQCTGRSLSEMLQQLLNDRRRLRSMSQAALAMGRPNAGAELAHLVLEAASGNAGI